MRPKYLEKLYDQLLRDIVSLLSERGSTDYETMPKPKVLSSLRRELRESSTRVDFAETMLRERASASCLERIGIIGRKVSEIDLYIAMPQAAADPNIFRDATVCHRILSRAYAGLEYLSQFLSDMYERNETVDSSVVGIHLSLERAVASLANFIYIFQKMTKNIVEFFNRPSDITYSKSLSDSIIGGARRAAHLVTCGMIYLSSDMPPESIRSAFPTFPGFPHSSCSYIISTIRIAQLISCDTPYMYRECASRIAIGRFLAVEKRVVEVWNKKEGIQGTRDSYAMLYGEVHLTAIKLFVRAATAYAEHASTNKPFNISSWELYNSNFNPSFVGLLFADAMFRSCFALACYNDALNRLKRDRRSVAFYRIDRRISLEYKIYLANCAVSTFTKVTQTFSKGMAELNYLGQEDFVGRYFEVVNNIENCPPNGLGTIICDIMRQVLENVHTACAEVSSYALRSEESALMKDVFEGLLVCGVRVHNALLPETILYEHVWRDGVSILPVFPGELPTPSISHTTGCRDIRESSYSTVVESFSEEEFELKPAFPEPRWQVQLIQAPEPQKKTAPCISGERESIRSAISDVSIFGSLANIDSIVNGVY